MNNYEFWEKYLKEVKTAIRKVCREKNEMHIDLHIHSKYSDGSYTVKQLAEMASLNGIDIIAITDHDTIGVKPNEIIGLPIRVINNV